MFKNFGLCLLVLIVGFLRLGTSVAAIAPDPTSAWSANTPLPYNLALHVSFSRNSKLYIAGGSAVTGQSHTQVISSISSLGGLLGAWDFSSSPVPTALIYHSGAQKDRFVYVLGGKEENSPPITSVNKVFLGTINDLGFIESWTQLNSLPVRVQLGIAIVVGNRLYFAGGNTYPEGTWNGNVYFADINADGTIGAWQIAGVLPEPNTGFGMIEHNGHLIVIGGYGQVSGYISKVFTAPIETDGRIGGWVETSPLPEPLNPSGTLVVDTTVMSVGGGGPGGLLDKIYYADLNSDGSVGPWSLSANRLPQPLCCGALSMINGFAYLSGGFNGNYLNTVYMSQVGIASSPTPTPTPLTPVILIPGMGASWNADALLNCKSDGYAGGWSMSSFAAGIYEPLVSALNGAGINVSVFNYDWRKEISDNQPSLLSFIDGLGEKLPLVGHSMGGLLGRAYLESSGNDNKLTDLVTVGSPHRGSALAYPAWSAGEIWSNDLLTKIAATLLLKRCGSSNKTDRQVIQTFWPSVHNLLPIDDYLRDKTNGNMKPIDSMTAKNNWQPTSFQSFGVRVGTLSGIGTDTLQKIPVKDRSQKDAVLGNWEDGKPAGKEKTSQGDGVVLASNGSLPESENRLVNGTHLGIVSSAEGINQILDLLGITASTNQVAWQEPKSALVVIGNNARLMLIDPKGKVRSDSNGVVSVINPTMGKYKYVLTPKKFKSELIVIRVKDNGDILYNEYKFNNLLPKFGAVDF